VQRTCSTHTVKLFKRQAFAGFHFHRHYDALQTRDNLEKNCGQLDLSLYQKCVQAPKKERKKSSWTFVLETNIKKDEKDPKKTSKDKSAIKVR